MVYKYISLYMYISHSLYSKQHEIKKLFFTFFYFFYKFHGKVTGLSTH